VKSRITDRTSARGVEREMGVYESATDGIKKRGTWMVLLGISMWDWDECDGLHLHAVRP